MPLSAADSKIAQDFALKLIAERHRLGIPQQTAIALFVGPRGNKIALRTWEHWESGTALPHDWTIPLILERLEKMTKGDLKKSKNKSSQRLTTPQRLR